MRASSIRTGLLAWLFACASVMLLGPRLASAQAPGAAESAGRAPLQLSAAERAWLDAHPRLRVATKQEWAPIDVYSYEGQFRGLSGDVLHLIALRLGRQFEYTAMPSLADGLKALREGEVEIVPSVSRTPAREAFMRFTQPYLDVPNIYLARRGVAQVDGDQSLAGLRIAVERGYAVIETIRERHPKAEIVLFDNSAAALRGVSDGSADVYLGALPTTTFLVEKLLLTNLEIRAPWRTSLSALHLGVAADNALLQSILDKALESITLAERQDIHRRWVPLRTLLAEPAAPIPVSDEERRFLAQMPALRIGFDESHYPYTFRDADGAFAGMSRDYLQLVTRRLGLSIGAARTGNWPEVYAAAKEHKVDMLVAVSENAERRADFLFVGPWISTPTVLVTLQRAPDVLDLRQLEGRRIAVLAQGQHAFLLRSAHPRITLVEYPTRDALLRAVVEREVDGAISNLSFVLPRLQEGLGATLKMAGMFPQLNSDLYFAVRRDQPMLAALMSRALKSVTEAERAAVASRWAVVKVDPPEGQWLRRALPYLAALALALAVSLVWALWLHRQVQLRRAAEAALARARDEAERLARARQEFVTIASHEIRTPVNAVIGALAFLKRDPSGPRRDELLTLAERSAATLQEFVNNLLDLSKSDAGLLGIVPEPADLRALLHDPVQSLQAIARLKGVTLELVLDDAIAPCLLVDSVRLRQVVLNLLSNALKYTPSGHILLRAHVEAEDAASQTLLIAVTDSGVGIPADKIDGLFERYAQAGTDAVARGGSSGLGLQLCRRIVDAMGGTVTLASRVGEGTQVVVKLVLPRASAAAPATAPPTASPGGPPLRVLLAEDDRVQQIIVSAMLTDRDCFVDIANDGPEALARWREHRHALVLTDCRMPGGDGYTFVRALRAEPGGGEVCVAGLSADVDDDGAALAAGMDLLLLKPLAAEALDDLLARRSRRQTAAA